MFKKGNFMKKILILFITIITLTGCDNTSNSEFSTRMANNTITKMDKYHFNYNGHQYIYFAPYAHLAEGSIVHDPDCPCLKK
jgi:hypothetical protein